MTKRDVNKFVLYITVILVLVIGTTNYMMYADSKHLLEQNTEQYAHAKLNSIVNQSAYFLHHFELELVAELVKALGNEDQVNFIRVIDKAGSSDFSHGQESLLNSKRYSEDIFFNGELLGHAFLELDLTNLKSNINTVLIRSIIDFVFSIILLGSLIYFFIKFNILTQFEKIKREKEKLNEEHQFISSIIDTSSNIVMVLDHTGNIVLKNKTCDIEAGITLEENTGQYIWNYFDIHCNEIELKDYLSDRSNLNTNIEKIIHSQCLSTNTMNGKQRVFEWQFTKLPDPEGHVKYIIGFATDITLHQIEKEELSQQAYHDALTSLSNRVQFEIMLEQFEQQSKQSGTPFTLLYIDLDNFKSVNDSLGHDAGDHVLITVANRLKKTLRDTDTVARLGGDEFAAILANINSKENAAFVAQKIINSLSEPIIYKQEICHIGASIGLSLYPADTKQLEQLMKNADLAMYQAKQAGKNTYRFFLPTYNIHL